MQREWGWFCSQSAGIKGAEITQKIEEGGCNGLKDEEDEFMKDARKKGFSKTNINLYERRFRDEMK